MKKYDLHIHTHYSNCSSNSPQDILKRAKKLKLDGIAITDHHTIKGALETKRLNKDKNFEVIIGEEITTEYGDIVALYLKKQIKSRKLKEVLKEVKAQKALSFIAHPFRWAPWQYFRYPLEKLQGKVDAIEAFNSRNIGWANTTTKNKTKHLGFAHLGSSDAHIPADIGRGYTLFQGGLRKAIKNKKTQAKGTIIIGWLSAFIGLLNKRVFTPLKIKKTYR